MGERVRNLRAVAMEHLPGEVIDGFGALVCDGCGKTVQFNPAAGEVPDATGWWEGPEGDLCPECAR